MKVVSSSYENNPPASLEVIFYGALPFNDRKVSSTSYALPLSYYPGRNGTPDEVVIAPTIPSETVNKVGISEIKTTFLEGYEINGVSGQTTFYVPDYSGAFSSITDDFNGVTNYFYKAKTVENKIELYSPSSTIQIVSIVSDCTSTWYPKIKNGYVYRDVEVTQLELDYSDVAPTGQTASGYYSGSWLKEAGFVAGDKVRLFYTLPQSSIGLVYSDEGEKYVFNKNVVVRNKNTDALHEDHGEISLDSDFITQVEKIEELSSVRQNIIFSGQVITGSYQGLDFRVEEFSGEEGTLKIAPPPPAGSLLSVDYLKESFYVEYRGFYDDKSSLWQGLDLNPQEGHVYNSGLDRSSRVNKNSEELIYRTVSLYLLPVGGLKLTSGGEVSYPITYVSAYVEGGRDYSWCPLRHYIQPFSRGSSSTTTTGKETASWGYGQYDISFYAEEVNFTAADKGIPLNQESAILISRIKIRPKENIEIEDARRFSGLPGNYDRKTFTSDGLDPKISRWDTSPWEGLSSPLSSTVLVEIDQSIIDAQGIPYIEEVVKKHLPPGVVPVIRPK